MSWLSGIRDRALATARGLILADPGDVPFGLTPDEKHLIRYPKGHSITYAAAGGGKSTSRVCPMLLAMLYNHCACVIVNDPKDGEICAQTFLLAAMLGRKVIIIDPAGVIPHTEYHLNINPFSSILTAKREMLALAIENVAFVLVPEPPGDEKNKYFRDIIRTPIEFVLRALYERNPTLVKPGHLYAAVSNPDMLTDMLEIEAEEGEQPLKARAQTLIEFKEKNPEHAFQGLAGATDALKLFETGSFLHDAGQGCDVTCADLIRERAVIYVVGPQTYMQRMAAYSGLLFEGFTSALMTLDAPIRTSFLLDEATNANLQQLNERITTIRAYGGEYHYVVQSRSEMERKFGKLATQTIEENCITKSYLGFSSAEFAKSVSDAMGEELARQSGINAQSNQNSYGENVNLSRQKLMTPNQLMGLPKSHFVFGVKDVGWGVARKLYQNQFAEISAELADNPLEGAAFKPDPKVRFQTKPLKG